MEGRKREKAYINILNWWLPFVVPITVVPFQPPPGDDDDDSNY